MDINKSDDLLLKDEINKSPVDEKIRREIDSLDDFEHLGHDSSPLKESSSGEGVIQPALDELGRPINIGVGAEHKITDNDNEKQVSEEEPKSRELFKNIMDSNLVDLNEQYSSSGEHKFDKFLEEMNQPLQPSSGAATDLLTGHKDSTQDFLNFERNQNDRLEQYTDSEPEDDFKPSKYQNIPKKAELPESESPDNFKHETFKDVEEEFETTTTKPTNDDDLFKMPIEESSNNKKSSDDIDDELPTLPTPPKEEIVCKLPPPSPTKKEVEQPSPIISPPPMAAAKIEADKAEIKKNLIAAEAIFCNMGLDTWFHPERLNPKVESLIYWRDPKKSGPIFGGVLVVLLALTYFSLISVVAYLSLLALLVTVSFRIYKNVVQAVQKTGDGHPFKEYLEYDISLPQDRVKQITEIAIAHVNAGVIELRRLFLVEDLVDSVKFGVFLWSLTYVGAWFNGMTLIIMAWVALFTLPKVYETNKTQIDANLEIVRTKLAEITSKVKAAIPIGKKPEESKKEQ